MNILESEILNTYKKKQPNSSTIPVMQPLKVKENKLTITDNKGAKSHNNSNQVHSKQDHYKELSKQMGQSPMHKNEYLKVIAK